MIFQDGMVWFGILSKVLNWWFDAILQSTIPEMISHFSHFSHPGNGQRF